MSPRFVVAPNALRGCVDAVGAAEAIARGLARAVPRASIMSCPVADGGDGTARVLGAALGGRSVSVDTEDALGAPARADIVVLADGTAAVELAAASGVARLGARRDPMKASTRGTGLLVRAALDLGCSRLVLALGGSATVDGGAGLIGALGASLLGRNGQPIGPGGQGLLGLERIDTSALDPRLRAVPIDLLCDVDNPLLGPAGAAPVFGPQKGASAEQVPRLEAALVRLQAVLAAQTGVDVGAMPCGGAAGGIAAMLHAVLGLRPQMGITYVLARTRFFELARGAELVVTAEGRLDQQTLAHKAPFGVASAARTLGVPTLVLAGGIGDRLRRDSAMARPAEETPDRSEDGSDPLDAFGAMLSVCREPVPLERAVAKGTEWLELAAEEAGRLWALGFEAHGGHRPARPAARLLRPARWRRRPGRLR